MFSALTTLRKPLSWIVFILFSVVLAACTPTTGGGGGGGPKINTGDPVPVALLIPKGSASSSDALLATSLENAARLAIADLDGVKIDLRIYPTAGQAGQASAMAAKAVSEGAKIILGPVFAESANAAAVAVAGKNINVLSFSNNAGIAGGNLFVLGPTFQNTANRLVKYSAKHGKRNILVVHGQDGAETLGKDAIVQAIANSNANLVGVTSFELSQNGVINAIPTIARDVKASGAQSVFFTSGTSGALPFLAQLLPEKGITSDTAQFLGLQRWDIPATAMTLPGLQGGWFTMPDPGPRSNFQNRYSAAYGSGPHPIAGLAYDGIAAIGALVKAGKSNALTRSALTQNSGFVGVGGIFRLLSNGTNERGLVIAQIKNNQVVVIDAAPRGFGGAGF